MYYLPKNQDLLWELVNKQFEMIGEKVTYQQVENGVPVTKGGKKKIVEWWKVYQFRDEAQYEEWKDWAVERMRAYFELGEEAFRNEVNYLDLCYGMQYPIVAPPADDDPSF